MEHLTAPSIWPATVGAAVSLMAFGVATSLALSALGAVLLAIGLFSACQRTPDTADEHGQEENGGERSPARRGDEEQGQPRGQLGQGERRADESDRSVGHPEVARSALGPFEIEELSDARGQEDNRKKRPQCQHGRRHES